MYKIASICFIILEQKEPLKNRQKHAVKDEEIEKKEKERSDERGIQATTDIFVRALVHKTHS